MYKIHEMKKQVTTDTNLYDIILYFRKCSLASRKGREWTDLEGKLAELTFHMKRRRKKKYNSLTVELGSAINQRWYWLFKENSQI